MRRRGRSPMVFRRRARNEVKSTLLDASIIVRPSPWLVSPEADEMMGRRLVATKWLVGSSSRRRSRNGASGLVMLTVGKTLTHLSLSRARRLWPELKGLFDLLTCEESGKELWQMPGIKTFATIYDVIYRPPAESEDVFSLEAHSL
jgi:hypothetical protein